MAAILKNLMFLVLELQSSTLGLTKKQMIEKCQERGFSPSKRTIERWLKNLYELGLEIQNSDIKNDHHKLHRYKLTKLPNSLFRLSPIERSALEKLTNIVTDKTQKRAITKILGIKKTISATIINQTNEFVNQSDYTKIVSPVTEVKETDIEIIENSIIRKTELKFRYWSPKKKHLTLNKIKPIGILYGKYNYLVAFKNHFKRPNIFRLDLVSDVITSNILFTLPENFTFKKWIQNDYGIFKNDKPIIATIEFSKNISCWVEKINFHPSQEMIIRSDKTLRLILPCKNREELIYELLHPELINEVKIIKPIELKNEINNYIKKINNLLK